jgi:hypothetical protein
MQDSGQNERPVPLSCPSMGPQTKVDMHLLLNTLTTDWEQYYDEGCCV